MSRVLIVEDQPILLDSVRLGFETEGFSVLGASTGREGRQLCIDAQPDAVILDLMLPDCDGLELLEAMRRDGFDRPVLILSARGALDQRIAGLNSGADDYLAKPFAFTELLARLKALLRRSVKPVETVLGIEDIVVDLVLRTATQAGKKIDLTARQFDLLVYLLRHQNEIVSRQMLARDIWREETATWTNVIEVQVNRLRNKLEFSGQKTRLHTIRGEGYLLGDRTP